MLIRYSRWDGSQAVPDLDADDLLSAMSDDLMLDGDPWRALRRLFQQGLQHPAGQRTPGLQDLLKQLRQQRQQRLDRYDLGGAGGGNKKKLPRSNPNGGRGGQGPGPGGLRGRKISRGG